jgi:hypothetical protein
MCYKPEEVLYCYFYMDINVHVPHFNASTRSPSKHPPPFKKKMTGALSFIKIESNYKRWAIAPRLNPEGISSKLSSK